MVDGRPKTLLVHRKGSTRAFPPGHSMIPLKYQATGQPVLVGGSMGTHSYILTGTERGMQETFGSTCHGAVTIPSLFITHLLLLITILGTSSFQKFQSKNPAFRRCLAGSSTARDCRLCCLARKHPGGSPLRIQGRGRSCGHLPPSRHKQKSYQTTPYWSY